MYKGNRPKDKLLLFYIRTIPNHPFKLRIVNFFNDHFFRKGVKVLNERGAVFLVSTREYTGYAILTQKDYEPLTTSLAAETVKNGGVVIDVGANVGFISINLSKITGVKVYAVDPDLLNFRKLLQHIKINGCKNITPINTALSYEDSFGYLVNESPVNAGTLKVVTAGDGDQSYLIRLCTLADVVKHLGITRIDLLKIDVEGYEINVLKGLFKDGNTVMPKNMILEYGPQIERTGYNLVDLFEYFEGLGYKPFDVMGRAYVYPGSMPEDNLWFRYMK